MPLRMDDGVEGKLSPTSSPPTAVDPKAQNKMPSEDESPQRRKSTRKRAAPATETVKSEVQQPAHSSPAKRKLQPVRGNWSPAHLLTNSKSKLATVNLPGLLSLDRAWTALSRDEQLELLSLLPGAAKQPANDDEPLPNLPRQLLKSNSSFLSDVRLFQEDLSAGRYDPVWLKDAQAAMEKRARGDFDDWKDKNREEFWGQKQKVDWTALAGETSQHSLATLVHAGYVDVEDIWLFRISQTKKDDGGQKELVQVEKEAKVTGISDFSTLSFTFPPGLHKFSSPANGEDVSIEGISNPSVLQEAIMNEDGRLAGIRRANAWKDFRCFRKNQDMGSLWDVRELYHHRLTHRT